MRAKDRVIVVGAGIGGLSCAIELAAQGYAVSIVERAAQVGGKMRECAVGAARIDAGPTVFTMRWVFDELFAIAGATFESAVTLHPLAILARHAWSESERFDLHADLGAAADAVGDFAGAAEARRFVAFYGEAKRIFATLQRSFLAAQRPGPVDLTRRIGLTRLPDLVAIRPFETLWRALGSHFHDPRLRQLFGRYATYNGSSPFLAPATLMLIAHVERDGVWVIGGGMQRLAEALLTLATRLGVAVRYETEVSEIVIERNAAVGVRVAGGERIDADAVVINADATALAAGLFGGGAATAVRPVGLRERSLSATTWALTGRPQGFPLLHHNVFFSDNYDLEFDELFKRLRLPSNPTVYVCAQDRGGHDGAPKAAVERLMMLVNAPPTGDRDSFTAEEIALCENRVFSLLERCGLTLERSDGEPAITTPRDFHRLFPATGGALYGRASHGWMASFQRPGAKTRIPGLYVAGGSAHPGAGVPMAALSGRLAAQRLILDRASTQRFPQAATSGGTSTA